MSEIKDRQDAASDIDPIVAALADDMANDMNDIRAAAAVEGLGHDAEAAAVSNDLPAAEDIVVDAAGVAGSEPADAADASVAHAAAEPVDAEGFAQGPSAQAPRSDLVPFEQMAAAYADTIVDVEAGAPDARDADDDGPLLDGELEDGIASVFAALHAAAQDHEDHDRDDPASHPLGDLEAAEGVTFRLLGELDRLWHRAA